MKKRVLFFLITLLALLATRPLYSLIPPTPDDELKKNSDIIVVGKVLGTVLESVSKDSKWKQSRYNSWVLILSVEKGNVKKNSTIVVAWNDYEYIGKEEGFVGGPSDMTVYPGTLAKLFLVLNAEKGYYHAAGEWNSAETMSTFETASLPKKTGKWATVK